MINTEICLFIKRSEIELENVHRKLRLLLTMVEADAVEDCLDTTHGILDDVRDATKDAAARIGSSGTTLSLKFYDIGKAQKAAAPETAKAKPAPEAETAKAEPAADPMGIGKAFSKIGAALNGAKPANDDIMGAGAALDKALAAAEAAKAALIEAAPEKTLKDTLDTWDASRKANAAARVAAANAAAAAECKGCGCDSEELADYGCAQCSCSKAADAVEGGELNG